MCVSSNGLGNGCEQHRAKRADGGDVDKSWEEASNDRGEKQAKNARKDTRLTMGSTNFNPHSRSRLLFLFPQNVSHDAHVRSSAHPPLHSSRWWTGLERGWYGCAGVGIEPPWLKPIDSTESFARNTWLWRRAQVGTLEARRLPSADNAARMCWLLYPGS